LLGRTLYDIAQLLESAEGAEGRVRRVLELLGGLVPYDQCAMLEAGLGREPRVVLVPDMVPDAGAPLLGTLMDLFGELVGANPRARPSPPRPLGEHLAVPLVGLDEVIGLLFVRSSAGGYTEAHLCALSVVAAELAAYVTMLRGRAELTALARELDESSRAAAAANNARDDILALLSRELEMPLSSILSWSRILRTTDDAPMRALASNELERTVQAQAELIDSVLVRARGSAAQRAVEAELQRSAGDRPAPGQPRAGGQTDERRLAGIRVLLVDNDLCLRESVQAALDLHGAEVTAVGSVPEVLATLQGLRPDVLLFGDLPPHGESIYELMREVTARACPLPVASISAWRFEERRRERAAGFQLHLSKPVVIGTLVDAVAELAGRTRGSEPTPLGVSGQEPTPEGQAFK
jgi:CheY-like chemotaxis protein